MCWLAYGLFRCLPKGQDQINISAGESKEAASLLSLQSLLAQNGTSWMENNVNLDSNLNLKWQRKQTFFQHFSPTSKKEKWALEWEVLSCVRMQSQPLQTCGLST